MMWNVVEGEDGEFHIEPVADHRLHMMAVECWCNPLKVAHLVVHNALDGRERYEVN